MFDCRLKQFTSWYCMGFSIGLLTKAQHSEQIKNLNLPPKMHHIDINITIYTMLFPDLPSHLPPDGPNTQLYCRGSFWLSLFCVMVQSLSNVFLCCVLFIECWPELAYLHFPGLCLTISKRTFTDLSQSHSCVFFAVCQGSLSTLLHSSFPQSWLVSQFLPLKHLHSMTLPPPCFTVGMVLARWWAVPGFLQTWHLAFESSILVSSDQGILFLLLWESFRCLLANKRAAMCLYWGVASVWPLYKALIGGVLLKGSPIFTEELWSPVRVTIGFLVTSLTNNLI